MGLNEGTYHNTRRGEHLQIGPVFLMGEDKGERHRRV